MQIKFIVQHRICGLTNRRTDRQTIGPPSIFVMVLIIKRLILINFDIITFSIWYSSHNYSNKNIAHILICLPVHQCLPTVKVTRLKHDFLDTTDPIWKASTHVYLQESYILFKICL